MNAFTLRQSLLLFLTAFIWGCSFVAQAVGMDHVGPFTFTACRTLLGALFLTPFVLYRRKRESAPAPLGKTFLVGAFFCGLCLFAGESFTQCPLTVDHAVLLNLIKDVKCGLIEDGTAVGMGIANAITRLKDSKAKSKVIILLTDGTNNRGDISPLTAAEIAKSFGIRVYTIGVGTNGMAPYPYPVGGTVQYVNMPVEIDEKTLMQIAGTTDGNYFRATSNSKLKEVYEEIDKLEKTKLSVKEFSKRQEEYRWFALGAFLCVLLEVLLRNTILKKIP